MQNRAVEASLKLPIFTYFQKKHTNTNKKPTLRMRPTNTTFFHLLIEPKPKPTIATALDFSRYHICTSSSSIKLPHSSHLSHTALNPASSQHSKTTKPTYQNTSKWWGWHEGDIWIHQMHLWCSMRSWFARSWWWRKRKNEHCLGQTPIYVATIVATQALDTLKAFTRVTGRQILTGVHTARQVIPILASLFFFNAFLVFFLK